MNLEYRTITFTITDILPGNEIEFEIKSGTVNPIWATQDPTSDRVKFDVTTNNSSLPLESLNMNHNTLFIKTSAEGNTTDLTLVVVAVLSATAPDAITDKYKIESNSTSGITINWLTSSREQGDFGQDEVDVEWGDR